MPRRAQVPGRQHNRVATGTPMNPTIKPGDVLRIPEEHYRYGLGTLILEVTEVGTVDRAPDGDWLHIKGIQRMWNGNRLPSREVLVRLSALRPRRRP
jgi:hypothetical protein